jgi:hypothetical protein
VVDQVREIAERQNAPFMILGRAGGDSLRVVVDEQEVLNTNIADLESSWRNGLSRKLVAEVPATV